MTEKEDRANSDEVERTIGRSLSWALPTTAVAAAIVVGLAFGVGPAILVLAAGALVGVIALLWASLRTLGGDAPLAEGLAAAVATRQAPSDASERKRRVLRGLKDLELEHSVGKIDDDDYAQISARYRDQAKGILREMDVAIEPLRAKAEAMARAHLAKSGLGKSDTVTGSKDERPAREESVAAPPASARLACPKCSVSNEPDATFCKKCGQRLGRVECGRCATSNEPDATFCKKCGDSLGRRAEKEPANATTE